MTEYIVMMIMIYNLIIYIFHFLLKSKRQEPSVCVCFGFHFDDSRRCADVLTNSLCAAFASHLISTPSPFLNFAVRVPGFKILDPFETSTTIPWLWNASVTVDIPPQFPSEIDRASNRIIISSSITAGVE